MLSVIKEEDITRCKCHTGHAYSVDNLLASITENIEDTLLSAIRSLEEGVVLLNNLGDQFAHKNQPKLAAMYFRKASEAEGRVELLRHVVMNHEQLTTDSINDQAFSPNGQKYYCVVPRLLFVAHKVFY